MAKILTDKELGEIVSKAVNDPGLIDDADAYQFFLEDLTDLVCRHFGGNRGVVWVKDEEFDWSAGIHVDEAVPADGGVYKDYDTDVTWKNGVEVRE